MKPHNLLKSCSIALVALGIVLPSARATVTYTGGDLLLGFRSTNPSVTTTLLVNLGASSFYKNQTTDILALNSVGSLDTDLGAVFGTDWATNATTLSEIQWGLASAVNQSLGVGGDILNTLYASKPEALFGTTETGYARAASGTQGTPAAKITTVGSQFNANTIAWVAGANNNAIIESTVGNTSNWAAFNPGATSFSYFSGLEGGLTSGLSSSALDLFRMQPGSGTGTYEGTFTLNSSGVLSYGVAGPASAVPEPSRALLLMAGIGSLLMRRRRAVRVA